MMACPCGGLTVKDGAKRRGVSLRWERCGSCGRCGKFRLQAGGQVISRGEVARRSFADDSVMALVQ